jgi:hypothetical protein
MLIGSPGRAILQPRLRASGTRARYVRVHRNRVVGPPDRVLPGGTAVLTVAHRLATACQADHVRLIDDGRVVEQGEPRVPLSTGSRFADLVALEEAGWDW